MALWGSWGQAAIRDLYMVPGTHRIWCDGDGAKGGKKEWSLFRISRRKKELAFVSTRAFI